MIYEKFGLRQRLFMYDEVWTEFKMRYYAGSGYPIVSWNPLWMAFAYVGVEQWEWAASKNRIFSLILLLLADYA